MFERFGQEARRVVIRAQEEARRRRHEQVGAEHLLLALAQEGSGPTPAVLAEAGLTAQVVEAHLRPVPAATDIDADALRSIGVDLDRIVAAVEERFGAGAFHRAGLPRSRWPLSGSVFGRGGAVRFDDAAKKALELALREAIARGDRTLGAHHVLLGLLRAGSPGPGRILDAAGVPPARLRHLLEERLRRSA